MPFPIKSISLTGDEQIKLFNEVGGNIHITVQQIVDLATGFTDTFIELIDSPNDYTGSGGYIVRVDSGETEVEFYDLSDTDTALLLGYDNSTSGLTGTTIQTAIDEIIAVGYLTGVTVGLNDVTVGTQPVLNFIEGSNVTLTIAEDVGNGEIDITIASIGGGGSGSTHTLLDSAIHTDTATATVTRGSMVYGDSTPEWNELVIGVSNTFLKSDGTDPSWQSIVTADVSDITATAAELNLLDLNGLTVGWALLADSPTTASWQAIPAGATTWLGLTDTDPTSYTGSGSNFVRVNSAEDGLEFVVATTINLSDFNDDLTYDNYGSWNIQGDTGSGSVTSGGLITFTGGTNVSTTYSAGVLTINATDTNTQLTEEEVQDFAWNVLTGTQTLITVTYQDGTNDVDFVVDNNLSNYDNTTSAFVAAHALLDGTVHTDTATATVTRGSMVYGDSTPEWNELVIGVSNTFLKSDGTDPAWTSIVSTDLSDFAEAAQDAVGAALINTATIDLTYTDGSNTIQADLSHLGIENLTDPNADVVMFWDDSEGNTDWLDLNSTLNITTTTLGVVDNTSTQKIEVVKNSGTVVGTRKQLNFIEGNNIVLTLADDAGNDQIDVTIEYQGGTGNTTTIFNDLYIDQSGGASDSYGAISGAINGVNQVYTVSQGEYATGTLKVWFNGQLQTQGDTEDWTETSAASGTFTLNFAPIIGDEITSEYQRTEQTNDEIVIKRSVETITTGYTISTTERILLCDASSGAFSIQLPTAVGDSETEYHIKKIDSTSNVVTVTTSGGQTIDGSTTFPILNQWEVISVASNNANWFII